MLICPMFPTGTCTPLLSVFLADSDLFCLHMYEQHLLNSGCASVRVFKERKSCMDALADKPDVVFISIELDDNGGQNILREILRLNTGIQIVLLSAYEDIAAAVHLLKCGASAYIVKGENDIHQIDLVIQKSLNSQQRMQVRNSVTCEK